MIEKAIITIFQYKRVVLPHFFIYTDESCVSWRNGTLSFTACTGGWGKSHKEQTSFRR
jgi:hypothetical protein